MPVYKTDKKRRQCIHFSRMAQGPLASVNGLGGPYGSPWSGGPSGERRDFVNPVGINALNQLKRGAVGREDNPSSKIPRDISNEFFTDKPGRGSNGTIPYARVCSAAAIVPTEKDKTKPMLAGMKEGVLAWLYNGKHANKGYTKFVGPDKAVALATTEYMQTTFENTQKGNIIKLFGDSLSDEYYKKHPHLTRPLGHKGKADPANSTTNLLYMKFKELLPFPGTSAPVDFHNGGGLIFSDGCPFMYTSLLQNGELFTTDGKSVGNPSGSVDAVKTMLLSKHGQDAYDKFIHKRGGGGSGSVQDAYDAAIDKANSTTSGKVTKAYNVDTLIYDDGSGHMLKKQQAIRYTPGIGAFLETCPEHVCCLLSKHVNFLKSNGDIALDILMDKLNDPGDGPLSMYVPDGVCINVFGDTMIKDTESYEQRANFRQGLLANIAVDGVAMTSTWSDARHLRTLPRDGVYMLLVATLAPAEKSAKDNGKRVLKDFRWMRSTSNDMLSRSSPHNGCFGKHLSPTQEALGKEFTLKHADTTHSEHPHYGEFIIGGWRIGSVMDNTASIEKTIGSSLSAPRTKALQRIAVAIRWMTGPELKRVYFAGSATYFGFKTFEGDGATEAAVKVDRHRTRGGRQEPTPTQIAAGPPTQVADIDSSGSSATRSPSKQASGLTRAGLGLSFGEAPTASKAPHSAAGSIADLLRS